MKRKSVLITGGTSGIGLQLAIQYAQQGARVYITARSEKTGSEALAAIGQAAPQAVVNFLIVDLADLTSVRSLHEAIERRNIGIDILVLNAGVHIPHQHIETVDKHELHHQVNYLSPFLLTHLLLKRIKKSSVHKIVYISSKAHHVSSYPGSHRIPGVSSLIYSYAKSKESATSFFLQLQRLDPTLDIYIISPGRVNTQVHRYHDRVSHHLTKAFAKAISAQESAENIIGIIEAPHKHGVYWEKDKLASPSKASKDRKYAESLWNASVKALERYLPEEYSHHYSHLENYAGTFDAWSHKTLSPRSEAKVSKVLDQARLAGKKVRVLGKLHSYNDIFHTDTCTISLEHFQKCALSPDCTEVICGGGLSVMQMCEFLDQNGYAVKFSGNYGEQTVVGAISTGTHGYYRHGGVFSELVTGIRIIGAEGKVHTIRDEKELQLFRLSFGSLGVITEVRFQIIPKGQLCTYELHSYTTETFLKKYVNLCKKHEYVRFYPNYLNYDDTFVLTIDQCTSPEACADTSVRYIADGRKPHPYVIAGTEFLLFNAVSRLVIKHFMKKISLKFITEFSSFLFVKAGAVKGNITIQRYIYSAVGKDVTHNMELAIPLEHYSRFYTVFLKKLQAYPEKHPLLKPYFTCRFAGACDRVLFAPNYKKDVVFVDVHCSKKSTASEGFMRELEKVAVKRFGSRLHWGKKFYSDYDVVRGLYPAESWRALRAMKKKYDPDGVFSNAYSKRVLGV